MIPTASTAQIVPKLSGEVVLDAFFIHALLKDAIKNEMVLKVPHRGLHKHRFDQALLERNRRIAGTGQEMWAHACTSCMKIYTDPTGVESKCCVSAATTSADSHGRTLGRLSAVVIDGVTVGHPCCAIHDCVIPLESQSHQFCPEHQRLQFMCRIDGCTKQATSGHMSCSEPSH